MAELADQILRHSEHDDQIILESLCPIFPQFKEEVLRNCIGDVRRTVNVGANRDAILAECINLLLSPTYQEVKERNGMVVPIYVEEDVVYVGRSYKSRKEQESVVVIDDLPVGSSCTMTMNPSSPRLIHSRDDTSNAHSTSSLVTNSTATTVPVNMNQSEEVQVSRSVDPTETALEDVPVDAAETDVQSSWHNKPVDPFEGAFKNVQCMFEDIEDGYLRNLLHQWPGTPFEVLVNIVCNHLLENTNYPKKQATSQIKTDTTRKEEPLKDYFTDYSSPATPFYKQQCMQMLAHEFRMVRMKDIKMVLKKFNSHYAPCKKALEDDILAAVDKMQKAMSTMAPSSLPVTQVSNSNNQMQKAVSTAPHSSPLMAPSSLPVTQASNSNNPYHVALNLLKCQRSPSKMPVNLDPELQKEVDFVKKHKQMRNAEQDWLFALTLNEQQYEEEGQMIECGCCYGEAAFEDMVQCMEGHLFCSDCLRSYAKEATFGQGKALLTCMTSGCDSTFPVSQLQHCLPSNILSKYEDRVQEESLTLAQMEDLVKCPSCDYAAIMPPDDKVFKCQNPLCVKVTCRYCKEDWSEHFGLPCKEVEKRDQKNVRLSYEEKMTMAKIRKCINCGCEFTKSDGCNKMTCRCGATQCYVCRKPQITYTHFCAHPRDPGKNCTKCKNCSLWSDPSEDDDRAVKELEAEAAVAKRKLEDMQEQDNPAKKIKI